VFDDHGGALLILGAPGTGKTTLLLELAQQLLDRAERDENHPIPVVFNLSSWAVRRQTLDRWLVDELNERSDVPKRLARQWVETEQVLPLLDGLDEVALDHRQTCVEAINNFRRDHGLLQIAVCSRIADYESLGTKLRLRTAVVVQPLTAFEVQGCLERIGEPAHAVRAALKEDPFFSELLETPLMLWVAMLAYRDAPVELSSEDSLEQRRRRLFASFIDAMFKRRSAETRYSRRQTLSWLGSLAHALTRNEQTVFYLENLREEWLPTRRERWLSKAGIILACVVVGGLIGFPELGTMILGLATAFHLFGLISEPAVKDLHEVFLSGLLGLTFGLTIGLICGLISIGTKLRSVEILRFSIADARPRIAKTLRDGLTVGLIDGLNVGLIGGVICGLTVGVSHWLRVGLIDGLRSGLIFGLIGGLAVGLGVGLLRLMTTEVVESSRTPNRGTLDSIKNAFLGLLISVLGLGLIGGLIGGLIDGLIDGLIGRQEYGVTAGMVFGVTAGMVAGYMGGGLFAIRHFVLRLAMWLRRLAPLNYVPFLDYAVERLFLRKVGGGYNFLHRMLLEYFAALEEPSGRPD
jgi:hypothetical protein